MRLDCGIRAPMAALRAGSRYSGTRLMFRLPKGAVARVALTFDDGPCPATTPALLDHLARNDARATFFLLGAASERSPAIVRRILAEGHALGSHGFDHKSARSQSTTDAVENAVRGHNAIECAVGRRLPRLFRPPYGELTVGSLIGIWKAGFSFAFWNYDSRDSFTDGYHELVEHLTHSPPRDRSIILFHDDYVHTVEAMPAILGHLRTAGYRFELLQDESKATSCA